MLTSFNIMVNAALSTMALARGSYGLYPMSEPSYRTAPGMGRIWAGGTQSYHNGVKFSCNRKAYGAARCFERAIGYDGESQGMEETKAVKSLVDPELLAVLLHKVVSVTLYPQRRARLTLVIYGVL